MKISKSITINDSENLARYFSEIRQFKPLNRDEEKALLIRIQQSNDKAALDTLVKANLRFVVSVAKKYQGQGVPLLDLINEGNSGLVEAAKRFDTSKDLKFFSYAVWWIRIKIFASMDFNKRTIQLPANREMLVQKVRREIMLLEQQLHRYPTLDELAKHFKGELSHDDLYEAMVHSTAVKSLNEALGGDEENETTLEDMTKGDMDTDSTDHLTSVTTDLNRYLHHLTQFEYDVLVLSIGLNGEDSVRAKDIAKVLGLRQKDINNIRTRAIKRLRKIKNVSSLKDYL